MGDSVSQFYNFLISLPFHRKISMAFVLSLVIAGFALMFFWTNQENYQVMFNNLSPEDGGAVISKLKERNVPYKVEANGTIIMVPEDKVHETTTGSLETVKDTAGDLMTTDFIALNRDLTVKEAVEFLKGTHQEIDQPTQMFVVDEDETLIGLIAMNKLLFASQETILEDIMTTDIHTVNIGLDLERVKALIDQHHLPSVTVIDKTNKLVGVITATQVLHLAKQEMVKPPGHATGPVHETPAPKHDAKTPTQKTPEPTHKAPAPKHEAHAPTPDHEAVEKKPEQQLGKGHAVPGPSGHGHGAAHFTGKKLVVPVGHEGGPGQEGHHLGHHGA